MVQDEAGGQPKSESEIGEPVEPVVHVDPHLELGVQLTGGDRAEIARPERHIVLGPRAVRPADEQRHRQPRPAEASTDDRADEVLDRPFTPRRYRDLERPRQAELRRCRLASQDHRCVARGRSAAITIPSCQTTRPRSNPMTRTKTPNTGCHSGEPNRSIAGRMSGLEATIAPIVVTARTSAVAPIWTRTERRLPPTCVDSS